jgi:hypothetical protein
VESEQSLLRHLKPDFKTIADFGRDNHAAFRAVFREFVLLCRQLDLFGRELLAVDSSRIKPVNKDHNFARASPRQLSRRPTSGWPIICAAWTRAMSRKAERPGLARAQPRRQDRGNPRHV